MARSIAEDLIRQSQEKDSLRKQILRLGGLDADVAEASALAHDLGHPPFGHIAEKEFDSWALGCAHKDQALRDGFEGNAQTFRIVTKLEGYGEAGAGLNLTAATNAAILKYPWQRPSEDERKRYTDTQKLDRFKFMRRKFGCYRSESVEFQTAREWLPENFDREGRPSQTLESSIMDIADDITYAVHDLEDFYRADVLDIRAITDDLQAYSSDGSPGLMALKAELANAFSDFYVEDVYEQVVADASESLRTALGSKYDPSQSAQLRAFVSSAIHDAVVSVQVGADPKGETGAYVTLGTIQWHRIQLYKYLVKQFVISRRDLAAIQFAQTSLIANLLGKLIEWRKADDSVRLPLGLTLALMDANSESLDEPGPEPGLRGYLDYLCSLTDSQAAEMHSLLSGSIIPSLIR